MADLFESRLEAIVIPTAWKISNGSIVSRARSFFPAEIKRLLAYTRLNRPHPGSILTVEMDANKRHSRFFRVDGTEVARKVIFAITKSHVYSKPTDYAIEEIAWRIRREILEKGIQSISIPRIAYEYNGRSYSKYRDIVENQLKGLDCIVKFYEH